MFAKSRIATSFALALGIISAAMPATAAPNTGSAAHGNNWNGGGNIGWGNNGWGNNGWNNNGWNNNGGGWNQQPQYQTISISIDRYVGNETLPLRQLGNIDQRYNGQTLRSVRVEINPWGQPGQVQLLVNGQVVAAGNTAGKQAVELRPGQWDVFGSEIQTLQLRTVGFVSIDDVELTVSPASYGPGGQPQPQPVCQTIERQLGSQVSFGQLNLNQLFNLGQYQGCRIGSVTFVANTAQGFGQAAVSVNGVEASNRQQVAAWPGTYTLNFWNQPGLGGNAPQIALNLMGQFTVHSVRLNLVRN